MKTLLILEYSKQYKIPKYKSEEQNRTNMKHKL